MQLRVGDVFAGKYRIDELLGKGGMGVVLAAEHLRLAEPVAIKLMLPELAGKADIVERFMREARAASKIKSEHVVKVIDVDVLPNGVPYMVMERLQGCDLAELYRRHGRVESGVAVDYVRQACLALGIAHRLGIVHRDLKPANLFWARSADGSSRIKILDFGISKLLDAGGQELTQTTALLGSPGYMSPEQLLSSRTVDARSDIWALGVVLYQLLTGTAPFKGDTMPEVCALVMQASPAPPRDLCATLLPGLEQVVMRCLQKDREQRYQTAEALAEALAPFCRQELGQSLGPVPIPGQAVPWVVTHTGPMPAHPGLVQDRTEMTPPPPSSVRSAPENLGSTLQPGSVGPGATAPGWGATQHDAVPGSLAKPYSTKLAVLGAALLLLAMGGGASLLLLAGGAPAADVPTTQAGPSATAQTGSIADPAQTAASAPQAPQAPTAQPEITQSSKTADPVDAGPRFKPKRPIAHPPATTPKTSTKSQPPTTGDPFGTSRE